MLFSFSLNVTRLRYVEFPPPFSTLLLSTRIKNPTSNEYHASTDFLKLLTGLNACEVIIFGAADGSVFSLSMGESTEMRRIFYFPLPYPISDFAMLYHIPSTIVDSVNGDIDECLIAVNTGGLVAACYPDDLQQVIKQFS